MKSSILFILLLVSFGLFGQNVPNTTNFRLTHVVQSVYGDSTATRNLSDAFTDSDASKFDPTYGSKTMSPKTMYGFRNYGAGCTRPSGLGTVMLYSIVNGVTITGENYCEVGTTPCGECTGVNCQSTFTEGTNVYLGTGTDCTLFPDGFYAYWNSGTWNGVNISGGKIYYCYV